MGLAAKLAATQQGGQEGVHYPQVYQQNQGYGAPPPQQYAQQGQQQGFAPHGYGAPAQQQKQGVPGIDASAVKQRLTQIVNENNLGAFYSEQRLQALTQEVLQADLAGLAYRWRLNFKLVLDLIALALYDIVIMADDSGSMRIAENGERIEDLKAMLSRITDAATMFDTDGISVRFMNANIAGNNLKNAQEINDFVAKAQYGGLTPLGTMLEKKILQPFVIGPAKTGSLNKPVLVIVITDGEPTGEAQDAVRTAIKDAKKAVSKSRFGERAVAFQFCQVGRDEAATKFLGKLDTDSKIGGLVDATSYYELEQEEYKKKGIDLTVDMYMVKLLVGALDQSYDAQDEVKKAKKKSLLGGLFK